MQTPTTGSRVAIVGGARTPFVKTLTALERHSALDLAVHSVDGLLEKQELDPASVDELVYGITVLEPRFAAALDAATGEEIWRGDRCEHRDRQH